MGAEGGSGMFTCIFQFPSVCLKGDLSLMVWV